MDRLRGPQGRCGRCGEQKNLSLPGIEPVARCCTNKATGESSCASYSRSVTSYIALANPRTRRLTTSRTVTMSIERTASKDPRCGVCVRYCGNMFIGRFLATAVSDGSHSTRSGFLLLISLLIHTLRFFFFFQICYSVSRQREVLSQFATGD